MTENLPAKPPSRLCPRQHLRAELDAQLEQLRGAGCTKIYREKVTGAHNASGRIDATVYVRSTRPMRYSAKPARSA